MQRLIKVLVKHNCKKEVKRTKEKKKGASVAAMMLNIIILPNHDIANLHHWQFQHCKYNINTKATKCGCRIRDFIFMEIVKAMAIKRNIKYLNNNQEIHT
ncbi:hypothetical protein ACH5RR_007722 [Cinchona calisaya]|uniref:Uncharacterized protein n=1 Tax=Cinchona calisaya TaxID=153742 RepID=A0ABD3ACX1_9GENT